MPIDHAVVSAPEWEQARLRLLEKEKVLTRLRDELSRERRALPWERVDKTYVFDGPSGRETLADLFDGRSQLVVYYFMFPPEWDNGCKSCSWWADNFERNVVHLAHRDVTLAAVSHAPLAKLDAFRQRMGWTFKWVSGADGEFSRDYRASSRPETNASGEVIYNFVPTLCVFYRDADGGIYHTYSCYARGVEMLNAGYHYLDLVPKGRDEAGLSFPMAWLRHRDGYGER
ncbi:MAG TPA: DUF899 family protein [Stellaceae bacterium]|nr:DUF899 family protein [Stellaceae bacterium]